MANNYLNFFIVVSDEHPVATLRVLGDGCLGKPPVFSPADRCPTDIPSAVDNWVRHRSRSVLDIATFRRVLESMRLPRYPGTVSIQWLNPRSNGFLGLIGKPRAGFEPAMIRSAGGRVGPDSATLAQLEIRDNWRKVLRMTAQLFRSHVVTRLNFLENERRR